MLVQPKTTCVHHTVGLLRLATVPQQHSWYFYLCPAPHPPLLTLHVSIIEACVNLSLSLHFQTPFEAAPLTSSVNLMCKPSVTSSRARLRTQPFGIPLETLFLLEVGQLLNSSVNAYYKVAQPALILFVSTP